MITGFNTDIIYNGTTYHVQTEDKGIDTPLILSLVYDRGTILASKRSPYEDLISEGFDEKLLAERLQKQHKIICAAIKAGRIEDLKRMTMRESAKRSDALIVQKEIQPPPAKPEKKKEDAPHPAILKEGIKLADPPKVARPAEGPPEDRVWDIPIEVVEDIVIEEVRIVEEETMLPAEAVAVIADFARHPHAPPEAIFIELLNETGFRGGERKTLSIQVGRGKARVPVSGSAVMVKVLGSAFRPLIFHAKTDSNGIAVVHLQMPHFKAGRAAILIKAMHGGEEAEIRRIVAQG